MAASSGAVSRDGNEAERMWNRLLSVERRIQDDREAIASMQGDRRGPYEGFSPEMGELYEKLVVGFKRAQGISHQQMRRELNDCYQAFMNFFNPSETCETLKLYEPELAETFKTLDDDTSSAVLDWLEDRQADSVISSPRIFGILSKFLECDQERRWESRYLKLFWKHSEGVSESDLVFCLNKVAKHYTPNPEVEAQEKFMQTTAKRTTFLNACSSADIAIWFSNDVDRALNQKTKIYDEKEKRWARKEYTSRYNWNKTNGFPKLANALAIDLPITSRQDMAKECLNRLELARHMSPDLNPHESDTLASVISTVISPEVQTLKALKNETKLYQKAVAQVEELSDRHLQAYDALKKEQFEKIDKFFQTCQKEKEDVVKEALYVKAKCLASIEKVGISGDVKMSSEDLLKRMLQEAGGAFKKAEGKHKVESLDKADNNECALCYSKFSKKRKRAFLDPCGHASACFDCATKAWEQKPSCPWCKAIVAKPICLPAKLFF